MPPIVWFAILFAALFVVGEFSSRDAERNAPAIGQFVEVNGARVHLVDIGPRDSEGPPIVLIHGASVNLRDMKMSLGEPLSETHRVIIVDRPGRGYSTRPDDGWMLSKQAQLIHNALTAIGVEKPVVVGQSLGGAVALSYALNYQDQMSGLVLLATVAHKWPGGVAWYNKVSGWPVAGTLLRRIVIPIYAPFAAKQGVIESFRPDQAPEGYYDRSGLTLLFRARDFRSNAADLRHLKPQIIEMENRYSEIRLPTAIVTGGSDPTVSPKLHSAALAEEIPGAYYEVIPNTGHALQHSQTARVIAAIDEILRRTKAE